MKKLGEAIRSIRERRGETMVQFAAQLGVKHPAISRYEAGKLVPSPAILLHLHGMAESAADKEPIRVAIGAMPEREEAFVALSKKVVGEFNVALRAQGSSSATRETFRDLVIEIAQEKYIPLWLLELLKLWRRHKGDLHADEEFAEAVAALDRRMGERPRRK